MLKPDDIFDDNNDDNGEKKFPKLTKEKVHREI